MITWTEQQCLNLTFHFLIFLLGNLICNLSRSVHSSYFPPFWKAQFWQPLCSLGGKTRRQGGGRGKALSQYCSNNFAAFRSFLNSFTLWKYNCDNCFGQTWLLLQWIIRNHIFIEQIWSVTRYSSYSTSSTTKIILRENFVTVSSLSLWFYNHF